LNFDILGLWFYGWGSDFGVLRSKFQGFNDYGFKVRFIGSNFWSFKIMVLMLRFKGLDVMVKVFWGFHFAVLTFDLNIFKLYF
jgi:hypothetical protein